MVYKIKIQFQNIIPIIVLLSILYILFNSYLYEKTFSNDFIMNPEDFEKNEEKYHDSELYQYYKTLNKQNKLFARDYIFYIMSINKKFKPRFQKRFKLVRNQIIVSSLISSLLFSTSMSRLFRQNTLNYFIYNMF